MFVIRERVYAHPVVYHDMKVIELKQADVESTYMICPTQKSYEQHAKYASQITLRSSLCTALFVFSSSIAYGTAMPIRTFVKG
jgi:hypothetical protein